MALLTDSGITGLSVPPAPGDEPMIDPFIHGQVRSLLSGDRAVSYGVSSHGYDARLAPEFQVFDADPSVVVDPKNFDASLMRPVKGDTCIIPPNGFVLGRTVEYFRIPDNVMAICLGKSTYARCGLIVNVTPLEAGWHGHVTIEISNTTPNPARVYANEGICQFIFLESTTRPLVTYGDRGGKYQGQTGVTPPRL